MPYILYLTSLGLVKGPKQTLWAAYNIKKIKLQAKNEKKVKKFLTLFFLIKKRPYLKSVLYRILTLTILDAKAIRFAGHRISLFDGIDAMF